MAVKIYTATKFRIVEKSGLFIPQHKSPFSSEFENFKRRGVTVTRKHYDRAEKFLLLKARLTNPIIERVIE